jgi:hypothetical protein
MGLKQCRERKYYLLHTSPSGHVIDDTAGTLIQSQSGRQLGRALMGPTTSCHVTSREAALSMSSKVLDGQQSKYSFISDFVINLLQCTAVAIDFPLLP